MSEGQATKTTNATKLVAIVLGLPWIEILTDTWKLGRKIITGMANEGMYEVLDYETTLELHDTKGEKATVTKREKVRYLQDNIIAFQDQVWGDGKILVDYLCTPGKPVDRYRSGHKTHILISLQSVRNKGDIDIFHIQWKLRRGFLKKIGFWGTDFSHHTKRVKVKVIFPKNRPPVNLSIEEKNRRRTLILGRSTQHQLPDGRWQVTWEKQKPTLYESYILNWEW